MKQWGNSKALTQAAYGLVKENPGMYRWTVRAAVHGAVIGGVISLVGLGVIAAGGGLSDSADSSGSGTVALIAGLFIVVVGMIAALTAANVQLAGLVSATDDVLHGRELDEQRAKDAARSRLGAIAAWSALSVAVGALVSFVRGDGDSGILVTIIRTLAAGLVAAVWAVVTTLVLPIIVLEHLGAASAVKKSAGLIRSTWGEAVFGSVRIGARVALTFTLPGVLLLVGGIAVGVAVGGPVLVLGAVLALVGVVLIIIGAVRAATCRNVFGVALYRWTTGEGALGPFSEDDLRGAVRTRSKVAASA